MRAYSKSLNPIGIQQGTWTPTIQDSSFSDGEGQTYLIQAGNYIKIGNHVLITGQVAINSLGTMTGASQAFIAGLPFAANSDSDRQGSITVGRAGSLAVVANENVSGTVKEGATYIEVWSWNATTGSDAMTITEISSGGQLWIFGQYVV